uniref:Uncharacterized protein n=1 Tax=Panagrolaimus superbus TaxID=310955 RepID=A0A914Z7I1_9BILA
MKFNYPEVKRHTLDDEIMLLCVQISIMFSKLNEIATEAERNLTVLGVQFDTEHRIVNMSPEARQYLQASKTPILNVYFAFGAEYSEYITDDMDVLPKLSVAHQLVIALQPRFPEFNRRKALTWLRRELPQIRTNYTPAERKIMPFPINAIEKAYLRDSKYFVCLSEINTDSEGDRKRMAEAKEKQLLEKMKMC